MKTIPYLTLLLSLAAAPLLVHAADPAPAESAPSTKVAKAPHTVPFRGTISAVDTAAGTFTIANKDKTKVRVFTLSKTVKLTKEDKDITLADVKAGDYARGLGLKIEANKFEISSAKIGPKTAEELAADKKKKDDKAAKAE